MDKENILETSRLWREVFSRVAYDYPDVTLEHMLVDNCAMQLVQNPIRFDVIVSENSFADILSDEAAIISGSIGMLPSASIGEGIRGLYEPAHGSAPDIAGQGIANPTAAILSVAMMMRYSFNDEVAANAIEEAVHRVLKSDYRTKDLAGVNQIVLTTEEYGDKVVEYLN